MQQKEVQYQHALLHSNRVVSIDEVDPANRQEYFCPNCHCKMYAALGPVIAHHFRHNEGKCKYDDFLHTTAEKVFIQEYQKCLDKSHPFVVEVVRPLQCDRPCIFRHSSGQCGNLTKTISYNLTTSFTKISKEPRVSVENRWRYPDILLSSEDGRQIWVEIWVSHETVEDKRKDGNVLEVKISSEKDIKIFREHRIVVKEKDSQARVFFDIGELFGFKENDDSKYTEKCNKFSDSSKIFDETINPQPRPTFRPRPKPKKKPLVSSSIPPVSLEELEWVDLGLPSGTLWAKTDSGRGVNYSTARNAFGAHLPTKKQAEELAEFSKDSRYVDDAKENMIIPSPNGEELVFHFSGSEEKYWLAGYGYDGYADCIRLLKDFDQFLVNDEDIEKSANARCVRMKINKEVE